MSPPDPIVIVTAADARFAMPLTISLFSALRRLDRSRSALVFVIDDGILDGDKHRCATIVQAAHPNVTIEWLKPDLSLFERFKPAKWHSRAIYLRLLIPDLLPEQFERVLYLDSDIVVADDLSPLWEVRLGDYPFWAIENFEPSTLALALPRIAPALNAPADARYHNSGVLLMNMPAWREAKISERAAEFLDCYGDRISFGDQDALNGVVKGQWGRLDPKWNIQLLTLPDYRYDGSNASESKTLQDSLLNAPGILHYTGPRKPWHWRYRGLGEWAFFRDLLKSGWFGPVQGPLWVASRIASHAAFRLLALGKHLVKKGFQLPSASPSPTAGAVN
jgi:lipopolysaccharide biosynthesis glycosyltransferase